MKGEHVAVTRHFEHGCLKGFLKSKMINKLTNSDIEPLPYSIFTTSDVTLRSKMLQARLKVGAKRRQNLHMILIFLIYKNNCHVYYNYCLVYNETNLCFHD